MLDVVLLVRAGCRYCAVTLPWNGQAMRPAVQGWRTFPRNHAPDIAAIDLFVVSTIGFDLLYVLVIIRLERRNLVWINVTPNPSAEWVARQITEAFPWTEAPRYLIRDRDRVYGAAVMHRLHSRQAHRPGLALAERLRRKADRIDPTRVRGSCPRAERDALASNPKILCQISQ
jgi:hypothetical protein